LQWYDKIALCTPNGLSRLGMNAGRWQNSENRVSNIVSPRSLGSSPWREKSFGLFPCSSGLNVPVWQNDLQCWESRGDGVHVLRKTQAQLTEDRTASKTSTQNMLCRLAAQPAAVKSCYFSIHIRGTWTRCDCGSKFAT
jgi:hypothetical protein